MAMFRSTKICIGFMLLVLMVGLFAFTDIQSKFTNLPVKLKRLYLCDPIRSNTQYVYEVAIGAIFQNEAPYLKEWIEFHKLVGVQHFYLFNNLSSDDFATVLAPYVATGEVDLVEWPYKKTSSEHWYEIQCAAYDRAVEMACGNAKWLAIIDSDEFLFPTESDDLRVFLKEYEAFGGVGVNWQMFGTSGVAKIPADKLMIETLLLKAPEQFGENINMKSIVRPETVASCHSPHFVIYKLGYFSVDANKNRFAGAFPPSIAVDKIRINHYWSRDEEYFYRVKVSRREGLNEAPSTAEERVKKLNEVPDTTIQRFLPRLKESVTVSSAVPAKKFKYAGCRTAYVSFCSSSIALAMDSSQTEASSAPRSTYLNFLAGTAAVSFF
jgi:hypothetical protein